MSPIACLLALCVAGRTQNLLLVLVDEAVGSSFCAESCLGFLLACHFQAHKEKRVACGGDEESIACGYALTLLSLAHIDPLLPCGFSCMDQS